MTARGFDCGGFDVARRPGDARGVVQALGNPPSDRASGAVLALALLALGVLPLLRGRPPRDGLLLLGALVLVVVVARPRMLRPINRAIRSVGRAVGFVVQQVTLSVLFFLVLTPMAAIGRLIGRDVLGRKLARAEATYWISRGTTQVTARDLHKPY